jgi:mono/diheme cytochrome c family protein
LVPTRARRIYNWIQVALLKDPTATLIPALLLCAAALLAGCTGRSAPQASPVVINNTPAPPLPTLDAVAVAQGQALYRQQCAECHGQDLEGAPEWKKPLADGSLPAPPHDGSGHTWHHPDDLLLQIIAQGGDAAYNSKMPGFSEKLSQPEMLAILEYIKASWAQEEREFQWWISATSR